MATITPGIDEESAPRRENARRRNRVISSCLECRRRKMKCDRADPCGNCRTSKLQCIYIKSAVTDTELRRKLKEVKEAKDAIDGALRADFDNQPSNLKNESHRKRARQPEADPKHDSDTSDDGGYLEPTPLAVQDAAYADDVDDETEDLGIKIGRMRLGERIGGLYRPKIADEILSSLQHSSRGSSPLVSSLVAPATTYEPTQNKSFETPSANLIFNQIPPNEPILQHIPPRHIADQMVSHYWSTVHPVARVLHRPSFAQRYKTWWELIENGHLVPPSLGAIVSSVMFSAVVAMSEVQVLELCHTPREEMKRRLQIDTETALSKANILQSTKIETLQAFVAYLLLICAEEISRSHSALTGMAIRIAECMGLHRDPEEYGFSPAEGQTRRLLWYQICYLDLRTSEIQGPRPFIREGGYTTRLPLDVTSARSLSPKTSLASNELVFSMIRFECQEMQRRCLRLRNRVDQKKISLTKAISKIEAFRITMDSKYGPYLNSPSPSPIQRMSSLVLKLFVSLLYITILHRYMNSVTYRIPDRLRQIVLVKGTEALEAAVELESAEDLQQWAWYSSSYQQYHTAFLLLFEVFRYPMRKEATRIWLCLDFIFADALTDIPSMSPARSSPTVQDVIAHRHMKARYLLTVICEKMRAYQKAKGLKSPLEFKDSMILITPQKEGDDSDPKMPLNYAHEEPGAEALVGNPPAVSESLPFTYDRIDPAMVELPSTLLTNTTTNSTTAMSHIFDNATSTWTSSGELSPWIQFGEYELNDDGGTRPNSVHQCSDAASTTVHESLRAMQCVEETQEFETIDPHMLEIDWNLWDSVFPPQVNDGNLDISDDYFLTSHGAFDPTV
ncbi:Transcription factor, fungi [Penicillium italicum]|uniref:Transcription factor, fungi n=1 Tax=Penicillium italicum TaxID=40296 RepID=A0A0A2KY62_PENIT|nr:Transcription factor, fungi [Penicillium italicum]